MLRQILAKNKLSVNIVCFTTFMGSLLGMERDFYEMILGTQKSRGDISSPMQGTWLVFCLLPSRSASCHGLSALWVWEKELLKTLMNELTSD